MGILAVGMAARERLRRRAFLTKLRIRARVAGAVLAVDVAPDARIHPSVDVTVAAGTTNRLVIAEGCRIGAGAQVLLKGGNVEIGPHVEVRRSCVLNVAGTLVLEGGNLLSFGDVIHCAESVTLGRDSIVGEYTTIADSRHHHRDRDRPVYHNLDRDPVRIGRNVWIAPKCTITAGVTIGDDVTVAAHSVVTTDVPSGVVVAGAPARPVRSPTPDTRRPA